VSNRAKWVYIANTAIPSRTAYSLHVMRMCNALAERGLDVTLLVPNRKEDVGADLRDDFAFYGLNPRFRIVKLRQWLGWGNLRALITGLRAVLLRPDFVYGRHLLPCYVAALAGCKVTFEIHEPLTRSFGTRMLSKLLIRRPGFRGWVAISKSLKMHTEQLLPESDKPVMVAPDAADPIDKKPPRVFPEGFAMHVGYVGNLYPGKGAGFIGRLAPRCPWALFHVVGGYPADVRRLSEENAGVPNLIFHGFHRQEELGAFFAAFDAVVAPYQKGVVGFDGRRSLSEWMSPLKLFEYMAAAKPIVCSDLPVLREILEHGETAWLCQPENLAEWERALDRLRLDRDLRLQLGRNAFQAWKASHTWSVRAGNVMDFVAGDSGAGG